MNVNGQKISRVIESCAKDLDAPHISEVATCIGRFKTANGEKCEVHLIVTKTEDEFIESNKHICITNIRKR